MALSRLHGGAMLERPSIDATPFEIAVHTDALWFLFLGGRMLRASQHSAASSHAGQAQRPSLLVPLPRPKPLGRPP